MTTPTAARRAVRRLTAAPAVSPTCLPAPAVFPSPPPRSWPLVVLALPAAVAIWSGCHLSSGQVTA